MANKRKRKQTASGSQAKRQKRTTQALPIASAETIITQNSPISKLPAEILTHILSYILTKPTPITLHSASRRRWRNEVNSLVNVDRNDRVSDMPNEIKRDLRLAKKSAKSPLLDILLVSRTFYFSGTSAFFNLNVFSFETALHLDSMTATLDLDRRRCIRNILFHHRFHTGVLWNADLLDLGQRLSTSLRRLPNLQSARVLYSARQQPPLNAQTLTYHARTLANNLERLKDFVSCKAELLELQVRDSEGVDVRLGEKLPGAVPASFGYRIVDGNLPVCM